MTSKEFTKKLPPFVADQLGITPPLMFRGVSARFFPLRANLDILQQLVDSYINIVPPEAGYFRVPAPYVNLVILDYGQMGESEMRTGWFSQVEVYFGVMLEWYKRVRGQWIFQDWGVITPYIFVNDDVSVPVGRTVFGYQKVLASVELINSGWMKNPIAPTTLARISTTVFPDAYTGGQLEERVFLELERASLSNMRVPADPLNPMTPWSIASNVANAIGGFSRDALWMAQSMRLSPLNPFAGPNFLPQMLSRMGPSFSPAGKGFLLNSINLKQFRRAEDPTKICYRALTNGVMQTTGFNKAGLLGEDRTLLGDLSGGHTIRLFQRSSLPIIETLGLEVSRSFNSEGVQVAELQPVMPFWADVDLKFGNGANLAWQASDGVWKDEAGKPFPAKDRPNPSFNNTVSTTIEAVSGPFQFTGTTLRVLPLVADRKKVAAYLDDYLNCALADGMAVEEDGTPAKYRVRLDVWAHDEQAINQGNAFGGNLAYVYLTASSFDGVVSKSNNVGDWAKYEMSFKIPVRWQRQSTTDPNAPWETVGVGLVPVFTLADNCITAFSRQEIQGIATGTANFVRPESVWLGAADQGNPAQTLLRVDVELLPALGEGQLATFQPVVEISRGDQDCGLGAAPDTAWKWAEDLRHELGMKKAMKQQYCEQLKIARALSLQLLGDQAQFSLYTLKEIRDVADPNKACYQSLVRVSRVLREVFDVREIEDNLVVRLYDYPSMNIVEALGLQAARIDVDGAGIAYSMPALRPFYIRCTLDEPLAERVMWRAGDAPWTFLPNAFKTMLNADDPSPKIVVDLKAETLQDQMDPSRTTETVFQARMRRLAGDVDPNDEISIPAAQDAVSHIDPQTVIESILSREWSNFDPQARWRQGRLDLIKGLGALPEGGPLKPFAEADLYRQINNALAARPGSVSAHIFLQDQQDDKGLMSNLEASLFPAAPSTGNLQNAPANDPTDSGPQTTPVIAPIIDPAATPKLEPKAEPAAEFPFKSFTDMYRQVGMAVANLKGEGAARRWREEVTAIISSQARFTANRLNMEAAIDVLTPLAVLGGGGVQQAYQVLQKQPAQGQDPCPLPQPTPAEFYANGLKLRAALKAIAAAGVVGEPSPHNNLDTVALAEEARLREMIDALDKELIDEITPSDVSGSLDSGRAHTTEFNEMIRLARNKCEVQYEALINKISRAYQKPDFCLRRDMFNAADRERLLPSALSWDPDWYYGEKIELIASGTNLTPPAVPGGMQSPRAASPPTDGSSPPDPSAPSSEA